MTGQNTSQWSVMPKYDRPVSWPNLPCCLSVRGQYTSGHLRCIFQAGETNKTYLSHNSHAGVSHLNHTDIVSTVTYSRRLHSKRGCGRQSKGGAMKYEDRFEFIISTLYFLLTYSSTKHDVKAKKS